MPSPHRSLSRPQRCRPRRRPNASCASSASWYQLQSNVRHDPLAACVRSGQLCRVPLNEVRCAVEFQTTTFLTESYRQSMYSVQSHRLVSPIPVTQMLKRMSRCAGHHFRIAFFDLVNQRADVALQRSFAVEYRSNHACPPTFHFTPQAPSSHFCDPEKSSLMTLSMTCSLTSV